MLPKGWTNTRFGNAFDSSRTKGKAGLPTVSVTLTEGLVARESIDRKMETNLTAEEHLLVEKGNIAYNMMRMWQGASGLASYDALVSPAYVILKPKRNTDPLFASYLFKLPRSIHLFWAFSYGITDDRLRLYFKDFAAIPVALPPFPEQREIAKILSTWDRAIAVHERLIENAREQKMALMQILLTGDRRLKGLSGKWRTKKLSQLCTIRRGASPRPINDSKWFAASGRGWVRISDVTGSKSEFLEKTTQYLSPEGVSKSVPVEPGELIMSICATIGIPKIVGIPVCIHDGFVLFRDLSPQMSLPFLFHFLDFISEKLASGGQPGTQRNLNTSIVGEIQFPDISRDEQDAIALTLDAASNEVRVSEDRLVTIIKEKAALMQQLLTGTRRVKIEETV